MFTIKVDTKEKAHVIQLIINASRQDRQLAEHFAKNRPELLEPLDEILIEIGDKIHTPEHAEWCIDPNCPDK